MLHCPAPLPPPPGVSRSMVGVPNASLLGSLAHLDRRASLPARGAGARTERGVTKGGGTRGGSCVTTALYQRSANTWASLESGRRVGCLKHFAGGLLPAPAGF